MARGSAKSDIQSVARTGTQKGDASDANWNRGKIEEVLRDSKNPLEVVRGLARLGEEIAKDFKTVTPTMAKRFAKTIKDGADIDVDLMMDNNTRRIPNAFEGPLRNAGVIMREVTKADAEAKGKVNATAFGGAKADATIAALRVAATAHDNALAIINAVKADTKKENYPERTKERLAAFEEIVRANAGARDMIDRIANRSLMNTLGGLLGG